MKGKAKEDYELVFRKLNDNLTQNLNIDEDYEIKELHTDFEIQIGEAFKMLYLNIKIKYCIWQMKRATLRLISSFRKVCVM